MERPLNESGSSVTASSLLLKNLSPHATPLLVAGLSFLHISPSSLPGNRGSWTVENSESCIFRVSFMRAIIVSPFPFVVQIPFSCSLKREVGKIKSWRFLPGFIISPPMVEKSGLSVIEQARFIELFFNYVSRYSESRRKERERE